MFNLYYTPEFDCPYVDGRIANNTVLDPAITPDISLYSQLLRRGFRRNGSILYRPNCTHCQQCIPTRVDTQQFRPNRSQKRCVNANKDLSVCFSQDLNTAEYKSLYNRYIQSRHSDTVSMHDCEDTFNNFFCANWAPTKLIEFRLPDKRLICLAVIDEVDDGWSDIYTFFSPEYSSRGLGIYSILWQINYLRDTQKHYLYLGYYIPESAKMAYKCSFQPLQIYNGQQWIGYDKKERA